MAHKYTPEQTEYLKGKIPGRSYSELSELFYKKFGVRLTSSQIKGFIGNRKLCTGKTGRFEKGQIAFNKGKKGVYFGGLQTQFKKGCIPYNHLKIGSERVNSEGYVDIKIADPNKWRAKHILTYEHYKGSIPKGHVVIFGDGNNRNFEIDNLIPVTRQQLLELNKNNLIKNDADLTRVGITIADLKIKISKLTTKASKKTKIQNN